MHVTDKLQDDHCLILPFSVLDTATTVSDSEAKGHGRRPRRRTTGGSDMGDDVEKAKRSQQEQGHSSEQDTHTTQTLSRQEIISMVKKRFGLKPGGEMEKKPNGIQEDTPVRIYLFSVITKGIFHFWCHWKNESSRNILFHSLP